MTVYTGTLALITCPFKGCHTQQFIPKDIDDSLRKTHESFYCIYGHGGSYSQKTNEEILLEKVAARDLRISNLLNENAKLRKPKRKPREILPPYKK